MVSPDRQFNDGQSDTRTVREAMNRIGLLLFPDQWTGKEYLDHWRLGLKPWPTTKLRGMEAVRELLALVWSGRVTVEVESSEGVYVAVAAEDVCHFHGGGSLVGDADEIYRPCRLRFPPAWSATMTSRGGRKGYDYAPLIVRILQYLDLNGPGASIDQITQTIRADIEKQQATPSYTRLQPFVGALRAYYMTRAQNFPESNLGTGSCDPEPIGD